MEWSRVRVEHTKGLTFVVFFFFFTKLGGEHMNGHHIILDTLLTVSSSSL